MSRAPRPSAGLFASLRQMTATTVSILQTRLALAGIELEEEIQRLLQILLMALGLFLFAALGLLVFTLMIVLAFRDEHRIMAMGGLTLIYLGIAAWLGWRLRAQVTERPPIFQATLAELDKDHAALKVATMDDDLNADVNADPKAPQ